MGTADFVFVYLATFLQRSTFDCDRMHRTGRLRRLLLAKPGDGLHRAHCYSSYHLGAPAGKLDCDAWNCAGSAHLLLHGVAALPAHHGDWAPLDSIVAGRDGNDWMDHLRRVNALQRGSRF